MSLLFQIQLNSFFKYNLIPYLKILLGFIFSSLTYTLIPLWFLKYIPSESTLGISSQYQFISLFIGVFQEVFSLIAISLLGKRNSKEFIHYSIIFIFVLGLIFSFIFYILSSYLSVFWQVSEEIQLSVISFFKISSIGIPFLFLNSFLSIIVSNSQENNYLKVKIFNFFLVICINFFIFYPSSFSLALDERALGYNNLIHGFLNFLFLYFLFRKISFSKVLKRSYQSKAVNFSSFLNFFITSSFFIILASIFRNFSYSYLFLKPLNSLGVIYSSSWFVVSSIFWCIYLIPSLSLAQWQQIKILNYKKKDIIDLQKSKIYKKALIYNLVIVVMCFIFFKLSYYYILKFILPFSEFKNIAFYQKLGSYFFYCYALYSFSFIIRVFYYVENKIKLISSITFICSVFLIFFNFLYGKDSFFKIKTLFFIDLILESFILFIFFISKYKKKNKSIDTFILF